MILIVDDSSVARTTLLDYLEPAGYRLDMATSGRRAWEKLNRSPEKYRAVLLDRMMPGMDGLKVLKRIKGHSRLKNLPVIMQTSGRDGHEIHECIQAGAYYYLTKPNSKDAVQLITAAAVKEFMKRASAAAGTADVLSASNVDENLYRFRSLEEVQIVANLLTRDCPSPELAAAGLWELLLNAVEHGNLCITYEEKTQLIEEGMWETEVSRRFTVAPYAERKVAVKVEKLPHEIRFHIKDEGKGFDWMPYLEIDPERMFDAHGRGIAVSRHRSFHRLQYLGKGNEVVAAVKR